MFEPKSLKHYKDLTNGGEFQVKFDQDEKQVLLQI